MKNRKQMQIHGRDKNRRGSTSIAAIGGVLLIVAIGGAAYWWISREDGMAVDQPILHTVSRGKFVAQVLDQGEVQSSDNVEIRCEARARNGAIKVIKLVPEGTMVRGGDFLVGLDSQAFEKERDTQRIAVTNAETMVLQATAAFTAAKKSWDEYQYGTFVESKLMIENELFAAQQEVQQAKANLEHTQRLYKKGFTTAQILRSNEIAVAKGENAVKMAETKLDVLEKITLDKNEVIFTSDIKAAEVQLQNAKEELLVQQNGLKEIEEMILACEIKCPEGVAGEVVFAKESSRRGDDWMLELGAEVRENQVLMRIPNPKKMEFKALINEQSITSIRPNMPATIKVDALNGAALKGVVTKVNQYAENNGWFGGNIRKYAVFIKIIDPPATIIPGMNGSATIQTKYVEDVVQIPVQAIYAVNEQRFVLLKNGNEWETREIQIDGDNSQFALVVEGVKEGDVVALNPGAHRELMDLPDVAIDENIELPEGYELPEEGNGPGMQGRPDGQRGGRDGGGRDGAGREGRGGGPGGGGGPGRGGMDVNATVDQTMQQFDKNSDGKLDKDELGQLDDRTKGFVEQADGNGDGEVTRDELRSSMDRMMQRFRQQQGGGGNDGGRG
jgi:HlyD family secretion protein